MPVIADFQICRYEDGTITINLTPPTPIGGWNIEFSVTKRMGGTNKLITKSVASGFNGQSGITITNSGQAIMNVDLGEVNTSGFEFGNYAFKCERLTSGNRTVLVEGYLVVTP